MSQCKALDGGERNNAMKYILWWGRKYKMS